MKYAQKNGAWTGITQYEFLYDDGEYSVIWGKYENTPALGVRWNDGTEVGYPRQGAHPTWYVEPDFLAISILQRLQIICIQENDLDRLEDVNFSIQELSTKMNRA